MNLFARLRRALARIFLRGRPLEVWIDRKMRRLERVYTRNLVQQSRGKPAPTVPQWSGPRQPRRILFISDVQWEGKELVPELEKICPVETLNLHPFLTAPAAAGQWPADVVSRVLHEQLPALRGPEPDVILFYARAALLSNESFDLLRKRYSCPLLGLNLDDKVEFLNYGLFSDRNDNYQQWARHFDLNLTNVRAAVDWYSDAACPVYYMPEGYHPKVDPPPAQPNYAHEFVFVGSWRAEREQLYRELADAGVPLEMFGFGWPRAQEGSAPEKLYRSSMITLGIGFASPSRTLTTLKTRDFECPGAGACYLTTYNWELALHYDLGKEILCYRSVEEIIELFSVYRRRPLDCWKIAQAAYRRCLNEHTWEKRFRKLFEDTGVR